MKNIFDVIINKNTKNVESTYKKWVIRKVTKKQEDKLGSMSQKYSANQQRKNLPKWLYLWLRFSTTVTFTGLLFLILMFLFDISKGLQNFFTNYLWLEIVLGIGILSLGIAMGVSFYWKKKKGDFKQETAEDLFASILETSKEFLNIPKDASSIEILSTQNVLKNNVYQEPKQRIYNNILLSVFVEDGKICFADLYDVIGIPLNSIYEITKVEKPYVFKYWHKKEAYTEYSGIKPHRRFGSFYEASQRYSLQFKEANETYEIEIPFYEIEPIWLLLEGRLENASITTEL